MILLTMATILSAVLLFAPFKGKYRDASRWLRSVWFIGSLLILAPTVFTLIRFYWQNSWVSSFQQTPAFIAGVGAGMLFAVVTSPEFRRRSAGLRQASSQPLEAAADRRDEAI